MVNICIVNMLMKKIKLKNKAEKEKRRNDIFQEDRDDGSKARSRHWPWEEGGQLSY